MPKIIWKGIVKSEDDFPTAQIPKKAKILDNSSMKEVQIKSLPFIIPQMLICFICMFIKTFCAHEIVFNKLFLIIGVIIGLFLFIVHELLHAIVYPKNAVVYIGIMPKTLSAIAVSSSPIKRNRFILSSILPVILGIIPLIIFCINDINLKNVNGILFGMAIMGMVSVYPDLYNIYNILRKASKDSIIQNNKNITYYYNN